MTSGRKRLIIGLGAGLVLLGSVGALAWFHLFREEPLTFTSSEEHFKYGSVGVEASTGIPYWVWRAMPELCADKLPRPGGFENNFGLIWEPGHDAPVGLPKKTIGFPRLGINCALCHTGTVRTTLADEKPRIVVGAPSTTFDLQSYLGFLMGCASDKRFTPEAVVATIDKMNPLSPVEKLLYRMMIVPATQKALAGQARDFAFLAQRPANGPGRVPPFNPAKFMILKLPVDASIDNSDMVPLWNWKNRNGFALHWDGLNTSLTEIVLNSGIGNGASADSVDRPSLERVQQFITETDPPRYPFPIDAELATRGEPVYRQHCASCHAFGGARAGQPIPIDEVGTDRHRLDAWSEKAAATFNGLAEYPWKYQGFRKTAGYVGVALDGIWIRAPYLHNGSVPTLAALLEPPDARPKVFWRGIDVFDAERVGFVSDEAQARGSGFRFDTTLPGNSNAGHLYGAGLEANDKRALLEYLKTL